MSPCFSQDRSGWIYRYYVSASLQQGTRGQDRASILRISAPAIEKAIEGPIARWLPDVSKPLSVPLAIRTSAGRILIDLPGSATSELMDGERIVAANKQLVCIEVPLDLPLRGGPRQIHAGASRSSAPDPALIAALRKAHRMLGNQRGLPTLRIARAQTSLKCSGEMAIVQEPDGSTRANRPVPRHFKGAL